MADIFFSPFENRTLKRSVFKWIRFSSIRYSSPHCFPKKNWMAGWLDGWMADRSIKFPKVGITLLALMPCLINSWAWKKIEMWVDLSKRSCSISSNIGLSNVGHRNRARLTWENKNKIHVTVGRFDGTGPLACLSPFSVMLWIRSNYLFRSEAW